MADLFGALVLAIVELIAATVQFSLYTLAVILESLGFATGHLADKPKPGERRFSAKRLAIAFAPLAILAAIVVGSILFFNWRADVRRARQRETQDQIEVEVERLAANVDQDGQLIRHPTGLLDIDDAWGNALRVEYGQELLHHTVTVKSDGADGMASTIDDLSSTRRVLRPKKVAVKRAIDKAEDAIRARVPNRD